MFTLELEDLAANAFISALEKDKNIKFLSYDQIEVFGNKVIDKLEASGYKCRLKLNRYFTTDFLERYSDIYKQSFQNNKLGLRINDDISPHLLITKFRGYLSIPVLEAFMDTEVNL